MSNNPLLSPPWILTLGEESDEAAVLDPRTQEVVFRGPSLHCLAYMRTTPLPVMDLVLAGKVMVATTLATLKRLADDLTLRGILPQSSSRRFLAAALLSALDEEDLLDETEH